MSTKASAKPTFTECSAELITSNDKGIWKNGQKEESRRAGSQRRRGTEPHLSVAECDGPCFVEGGLERERTLRLLS